MNGFFNILKPVGISSAAVVAALRRMTGIKRIGHAGTLDPEAAGVLPVMIGKATRLFDYLTDKEKEYEAVIAFGSSTDTQDFTGHVIETGDCFPERSLLKEAADKLTGDIIQIPSMYSAIKVQGEPLYKRARKGEQLDVPSRIVHIEKIDIISEAPDHGFVIRVRCGKGTYIRTLCHDLGRLCGCPAHMRSLLRTQSGVFMLADAISLEEAKRLNEEGKLLDKLLPPDYALQHLPAFQAAVYMKNQIINGVKIPATEEIMKLPEDQPVRIYLEDDFWGIAERKGEVLRWKALIAPDKEPEGQKHASDTKNIPSR